MEGRKYLLINDINTLGKFYLHYASISDHPNRECLRAVLKVEKRDSYNFYLTPGYISYDDKFFFCPLSIIYVQLNYIEAIRKGDTEYVNSEIVVFSKDFNNQRKIQIELSSYWLGSGVVNPMYINDIVNSINEFVHSGYEIQDLNELHFRNMFDVRRLTTYDLIEKINNLEFKFYSNSQNRVGKDNSFWREIEITNLPNSKYIVSLFQKIINDSEVVNSVKLNDSMLFATYDRDYGYCPADGRKEIQKDMKKANEIMDILKLLILENFDSLKEKNDRLIKLAPKN